METTVSADEPYRYYRWWRLGTYTRRSDLSVYEGAPASIATLFHELVHASALRFEKSGVFRRKPRPKDVSSGLSSFDELMANSVGELGAAFLGMMAEGHAEG